MDPTCLPFHPYTCVSPLVMYLASSSIAHALLPLHTHTLKAMASVCSWEFNFLCHQEPHHCIPPRCPSLMTLNRWQRITDLGGKMHEWESAAMGPTSEFRDVVPYSYRDQSCLTSSVWTGDGRIWTWDSQYTEYMWNHQDITLAW